MPYVGDILTMNNLPMDLMMFYVILMGVWVLTMVRKGYKNLAYLKNILELKNHESFIETPHGTFL
jgi:hypothetical protein